MTGNLGVAEIHMSVSEFLTHPNVYVQPIYLLMYIENMVYWITAAAHFTQLVRVLSVFKLRPVALSCWFVSVLYTEFFSLGSLNILVKSNDINNFVGLVQIKVKCQPGW